MPTRERTPGSLDRSWKDLGAAGKHAAGHPAHERTTPRMTVREVPVTAIIALALLAALAVTVGTITMGLLGAALFIAGVVTGWLTSP